MYIVFEMKKNVMIRIEEKLWRKAKDYGLNISKVSENALKEMIARIEKPSSREQRENCSNDCSDNCPGAAAGIRTRVTGLGGRRLRPGWTTAALSLQSTRESF